VPNVNELIEVYVLAQFFYSRSGAAGVVILTDKPELLIGQFSDGTKLVVVCSPRDIDRWRNQLGAVLPNAEFLEQRHLNNQFLADKIFVCVDYLSGHSIRGALRRQRFKRVLSYPVISISVAKSGLANQPLFAGKTRRFINSTNKNQQIVLGGQLLNINRHKFPSLSVLAIMHVYNEQDIIATTINYLLEQGIDVHIIDNWSTDKSYEIVQSLARSSKKITYERFPEKANNRFELARLLTRATEVAKARPQYAWVTLNDADEFRQSPWPGVSLQQAFSFIDSLGYNAVDYTVFNFVPVSEDFNEKQNPLTFFEYGEFSTVEGHFVQVKSWKNNPEADLASSGGHHVNFEGLKIFPLKFFLGHYPIRSTKHAREKIFQQRKSRFSKTERQRGWHVQYDDVDEQTSFIGDKKKLVKFSAKSFWGEFIVERLSGIGIKKG